MSDRIKYPAAKQDVEILESLVEDYNQDRVSALIGAGFSMNVSSDCYKSWGGLLRDACKDVHKKEIGFHGKLSSNQTITQNLNSIKEEEKQLDNIIVDIDYLQLVSQFIKLRDNNHEAIDTYIEFRTPRAIKEGDEIKLKYINGKEVNVSESNFKVHKQLLSCSKFKNLFTTNYDNLLEFTVENFQSDDNKFAYSHLPVCKSQHLSNSISDKKIIKIHGNLREYPNEEINFDGDRHAQYIISQEDYDTYKQKHEAFAYLMRLSMLLGKFCLIGFSGSDPNYKGWLNWMKDILDKETNNDIKVYLINIKKDYKAHESEEWAYTERMVNRNHRIAVIHLYDKKVLKRINPGFVFKDDDYEKKIKTLKESEVLSWLFKYIAESEKNFEPIEKPSNTGCFNYDKGYNYYYGLGVNKDHQLAFKYLDLSVTEKEETEKENEAKELLAECYLYGRGVEINVNKAAEYCKDNEKTPVYLLFRLASCFHFATDGVEKNMSKAIEWYKKAAEKGDIKAMVILGWIYAIGEDVDEDMNEAIEWFTKAADKGDVFAMYMLGTIYIWGCMTKNDVFNSIITNAKKSVQEDFSINNFCNYFTKFAENSESNDIKNAQSINNAFILGSSDVLNALGFMSKMADGVEKDIEKALKWFTKAAEQGNVGAMNNLAMIYCNGYGAEKDTSKAIEWYKKAAEQGETNAMIYLAEIYYNGDGVEKDMNKAIEWCTKAAEKGYILAMLCLALIYRNGDDVYKDMHKAVEWFTKAAEQGETNAMIYLAEIYYNGDGVGKDIEKAFEWLNKAAEKGHRNAMFGLALIYQNGDIVKKNMNKAVEWYTKAAEQGNAEAMNNLAVIYRNGNGVEKDINKAIEWYKKAAEQGHAKAQFNLGYCYQYGEGVPEDKAEAVKWYTKAAEQGLAQAQFNLALCYYNGDGVPEDKAEAVKWYTKVAEQGDAQAQFNLGNCYDNGEGVPEDKAEAMKWYKKAAEQGHAGANNGLAWIYQEQGRYEEALPFINKALEFSPDNANYIDTLAMIYQGLGRYDEAMEQFEKALKIAEEEKDERLINGIQDHIQALKDQMGK